MNVLFNIFKSEILVFGYIFDINCCRCKCKEDTFEESKKEINGMPKRNDMPKRNVIFRNDLGIEYVENNIKINGDGIYSYNAEVFKDTQKRFLEKSVKDIIELSKKFQSFIKEDDVEMKVNGTKCNIRNTNHTIKNQQVTIELQDHTIIQSALYYLYKTGHKEKVAILNFADWTDVGGLVTTGAETQEEAICRCSSLYACISDITVSEYYSSHKKKVKSEGNIARARANNDIIYTPNVVILKDDSDPNDIKVLKFNNENIVSVITCAAPWNYYSEGISFTNDEIYNIHKAKAKRIFDVALTDNVDIIILGAYGCGAFRNDPAYVSKAYYDLLIKEGYVKYFKKVVFAIPTFGKVKDKNHNVFKNKFKL